MNKVIKNLVYRIIPIGHDGVFFARAEKCAWHAFYLYVPWKTSWYPILNHPKEV